MCILDIDKDKLTLPEDIPMLPFRDQLISELNLYINIKSPSQHSKDPTNCFSALSDPTPSNTTSPAPCMNMAQRKIKRPPRLNFATNRSKSLPSQGQYSEEKFYPRMLEFNSCIRYIFLDHICKIFLNYEKFIIFPRDKQFWEENKDSEDNFERDVFLCDQPPQNLSFLSRFLETNMFSCFIDSKIGSVFNVVNENVTTFDTRVEHMKKVNMTEIMSPLSSESK